MTIDFLLVAAGILLLAAGGEVLIRGALAAARRLAVSPLLSGLVIVGFGTSAPELVVSAYAALAGRDDIAVGNVVGSNIGNVLLILGLCAAISPLAVKPRVLVRDGAMVVVASALFAILVIDRRIGAYDAAFLLAVLTGYLVWAYWSESRRGAPAAEVHQAEAEELTPMPRSAALMIAMIVSGLALLVGGSRVLLVGAVGIADGLGLPEAVVGLTLVAVGTSLPELSVSLIATLRGHADVAVGNILGSNLFNVLGILGLSALLEPLAIASRIVEFDQWVMLGSALLLMVFLYTGMRLSRTEGTVLLVVYAAYLWSAVSQGG